MFIDVELLVENVFHNILIARIREEIEKFWTSVSAKFKIGEFNIEKPIVLKRLHIEQSNEFRIAYSMDKFRKYI